MNAGEISNQRIRKEKQSLGTDDCDVTPSRADDAGLKIAFKHDRHLPCASTSVCPIPIVRKAMIGFTRQEVSASVVRARCNVAAFALQSVQPPFRSRT